MQLADLSWIDFGRNVPTGQKHGSNFIFECKREYTMSEKKIRELARWEKKKEQTPKGM